MSFLTTDFEKEARIFQAQWEGLKGRGAVASFPEWRPKEWRTMRSASANCYNLTLNINEGKWLIPGMLSGQKLADCKEDDFYTFAEKTRRNALLDGLSLLEDGMENVSEGQTPAVLFFRHKDETPYELKIHNFHWFAIRRKGGQVIAVEKDGYNFPEEVKDSDIFSSAKKEAYNYFGGCFAVPKNLSL